MQIRITVKGTDHAIARLRALQKLDFHTSLDQIGKYMTDFYGRQVFDTEGSIIGERWKPLSPRWEFAKRRKYPGAGILVASGTLRDNFKYLASSNKLLFTNDTPYGMVHQKGSKKKGIPQRKFFKVDDPRKKKMSDIIRAEFRRKLYG